MADNIFDEFRPKPDDNPFAEFAKPKSPTQVEPAAGIKKPAGVLRRVVGDTAVDLARGVVGAGESLVGLADIPTGGYAGKALDAVGYRPVEAKEAIGELYSAERQAANAAVEDADGFIGTAKAMLQRPSTIAGMAVESVPVMLGGGAIAKKLANKIVSPVARAAIGEGAVGAGMAAESLRQGNEDGLLDARDTVAALGAGLGTGLLGAAGGKIAHRLGFADVDTAIAGAGKAPDVAVPGAALADDIPKKKLGLAQRTVGGAISEGLFEEAPQSAQEQMWQNYATDKPLGEGVPEATAAGMLTGAAIGGPFAAIAKPPVQAPPPVGDNPDDTGAGTNVPNSGTVPPNSGMPIHKPLAAAIHSALRPARGSVADVASTILSTNPAPGPLARTIITAAGVDPLAASAPPETPGVATAQTNPLTGQPVQADPTQIVEYLITQAAANSQMPGVSAIAKAYGIDKKDARALRQEAQGLIKERAKAQENEDGQPARGAVDTGGDLFPSEAGADSAEHAGDVQAAAAEQDADRGDYPDAQTDVGAGARDRDAADGTVAGPAAGTQEEGLNYDESDELQDDDITAPSGGAFENRGAAENTAKRHEGGKVYEVEGGFVVRTPKAAEAAAVESSPATPSSPAAPESEALGQAATAVAQSPSESAGASQTASGPSEQSAGAAASPNDAPAAAPPQAPLDAKAEAARAAKRAELPYGAEHGKTVQLDDTIDGDGPTAFTVEVDGAGVARAKSDTRGFDITAQLKRGLTVEQAVREVAGPAAAPAAAAPDAAQEAAPASSPATSGPGVPATSEESSRAPPAVTVADSAVQAGADGVSPVQATPLAQENWTARGEKQTRVNISPARTADGTEGGIKYELRNNDKDGNVLELWVARDGSLVGRDKALSDEGAHTNLWTDGTPEQQRAVVELLRKRGEMSVLSPERKALDQQVKDIVSGAAAQGKKTGIHETTKADDAAKAGAKAEPWQMTRNDVLAANPHKDGVSYLANNRAQHAALDAHKAAVEKAAAEGKPVPANVLADYPDIKTAERETAQGKPLPNATATPKPDPKKRADKRSVKSVQTEIFQTLSTDATMIGKSVADLEAEVKQRADGYLGEAQVSTLARSLAKTLKAKAAELEKEKHRNPTVRNDAIVEAADKAGLTEGEGFANFNAGFEHALKGKTKSTLSGEGLPAMLKGYEAARAWIKTEIGRAYYEGRPSKKLENTGADLRRWWEEQKAALKSKASDGTKLWAHLKRQTTRADVFPISPAAGATPGVTRLLELARDNTVTFADYFANWSQSDENHFSSDGRSTPIVDTRRSKYQGSIDKRLADFLDRLLTNTTYGWKDIDAPESEWTPDPMSTRTHKLPPLKTLSLDERREIIVDVARQYLSDVQALRTAIEGATTAAAGAEAINTFRTAQPDAYKRLLTSRIGGKRRKRGDALEGGKWTRIQNIIDTDTAPIADSATRATPLTPPRLDRVTREDMTDQRKGKDVTPAEFKSTFGFADVGFGKWVNAKQDQDHLNYAFDAFMDLANHFGIPPKMIGLGGDMHFTIGALGHGKFAAHFQAQQAHPNGGTVPVINVTNTRGDGTVYHEWAHAFDLHGAHGDWPRVRAKLLDILTKRQPTAADVDKYVRGFLIGDMFWQGQKSQSKPESARKALRDSQFERYGRSKTQYKIEADKLGEDYWGNDKELIARAVEAWSGDTLGGTNTYLVNPGWSGEGVATPEKGYRGTPYPAGAERKLFNTVLTALTKAVSVADGKLTVSLDAFNAALPDLGDGETRRQELLKPGAMEALYESLLAEKADDARQKEQAKADAARKEAEEIERLSQEALAGVEPVTDADLQKQAREFAESEAAKLGLTRDSFLGGPAIAGLYEKALAQLRAEAGIEPPMEPAAAPATLSSEAMGELSREEIEAIFDQALAQEQESTQEQPNAPAPGEAIDKLTDSEVEVNAQLQSWLRDQLAAGRPPSPARVREQRERLANTGADKAAKQAKTAAAIAADAAKLGVQGIDEAMQGLVKLFGGGPGKLNSFPAGFDEDAYKAAKPHFEAAFKAFQAAGKSLVELFQFLIAKFGPGIKMYAVQFVEDQKATAQLGTQPSASMQVADWVKGRLTAAEPMVWRELFAAADKAFGGTQADGTYTPKDAYDALEAGVNLYLQDRPGAWTPAANADAAVVIVSALEAMTQRLPTQSKRTAEMDEFQQFSTVPPFAFLANWVANITAQDTMLEPSAGIGGLAVFAKNAGAKLVLNELSSRRAAVLQEVFPSARVFHENAEQIDNILPDDISPSVVVMNPPFSASAGRMQGARSTAIGAQHVEQALNRLADGGRLVAIVGQGMSLDSPTFKDWWAKIRAKHDVRAVVPVDGSGYAKYGTTFDNIILVIDKVAPTGRNPVTTPAKAYNDLVGILSEIRNDRPTPAAASASSGQIERDAAESARSKPDDDSVGVGPDPTGPAVLVGGEPGPRSGVGGQSDGNLRDDAVGQPGSGVSGAGIGRVGNARGNDAGRSGTGTASPAGRPDSGVKVTATDTVAAELTESIFEEGYQPQRLTVAGSRAHPGALVESAAMASVLPPEPTYTPDLSRETIEGFDIEADSGKRDGGLSLPQLEAVVYAGQAHEQILPDGSRRGFFIGDGTGVGKGREIAGIILDNLRRGRKKAVWVTEKQGLLVDAKRDYAGVGGDPTVLFNQKNAGAGGKAGGSITGKADGVLFTTYKTLSMGFEPDGAASKPKKPQTYGFGKNANVETSSGSHVRLVGIDINARTVTYSTWASTQTVPFGEVATIGYDSNWRDKLPKPKPAKAKKEGLTRMQQLVEWLGPDYDGVLVFDEAHNAGNSTAVKGKRGGKDPANQALAVVELQKLLPLARVVYVSATGATQVSNLAFASRLGLWGKETAFAAVSNFIEEMASRGLATMELIARDMKQMGAYLARSLSFSGVTYSRIEHRLSPLQRDQYDRMADAWQVTLQNFEKALEVIGAKRPGGKAKSKDAVKNAKAAYWGSNQRFFNQIITSMQMPSVIEQMEQDLAAGDALVLQLVNTNEAQQERSAAKQKAAQDDGDEVEFEELDLTPREQLLQMVEKSFPVQQYEDYTDSDGKRQTRAVVDSEGNPVHNKEAVAMRDKLLDDLRKIKVPDGPLEQIIDHFGPDIVAEVTGRKRRFVDGKWNPDSDKQARRFEQKRGSSAARSDADSFMADKKRIMVFSDAGGTGYSFHADNTKVNQRKRKHYLIQPGWRADKAVQGFGRTHRTNQASAPHYYLAATDIPAHARFLSSIARRLDQLGALTKGQRDAANQGLFSEKDNLESIYATQAVQQLFTDVQRGQVPGLSFKPFMRQLGLENIVNPETGAIAEKDMPETSQFLNRLLSLNLDMQETVFAAFASRMEEKVQVAIQNGDLDTGIETIKAIAANVVSDEVIYTDPRTKATTRFVEIDLTQANQFYRFPDARYQGANAEWVVNKQSGRVWLKVRSGTRTLTNGAIVDRYRMLGTGGTALKDASDFEAKRGEVGAPAPYDVITEDEASALWEKENGARPPTVQRKSYFITGALLPIWDRLQTATRMSVARVQTDKGRLLGLVISAKDIAEIRKRFDLTSPAAKMAPADVMTAILKGQTGVLANGWKLERAMVSGQLRIEIKAGALYGPAAQELVESGVIQERIDWKERYFIPVGKPGVPVLEQLFKSKPMVDLIDPKAAEAPALSRSDKLPPSRSNANASGIPTGLPVSATADTHALEQAFIAAQPGGEPPRLRAVKPDSLPDALRRALAALERFAGGSVRVTIIRNLNHEKSGLRFNGVTLRRGVLYVDEDAQSPATTIAAHEYVHQLRRDRPDLYNVLEAEVRRQGRIPEYTAALARKGEPDAASVAVEELTADAVGDALTDRGFLEAMAKRNPSKFKQLADAFLAFLDSLLGRVRDLGSNAYLQDVAAFRAVLAEVLERHDGPGDAAGTDAPALSREAPMFYSALLDAIGQGKGAPKKGNAAAWNGWLDGAMRRGEFKQAERDWLGLDAWIAEQGTVTREQLSDFVRAHQVKVKLVTLSEKSLDLISDELNLWMGDNLDQDSLDGDVDFDDVANTLTEIAINHTDDGEPAEAERYRKMAAEARKLASGEQPQPPKFGGPSTTFQGGKNYQEGLVTLPESGKTYTHDEVRAQMDVVGRAAEEDDATGAYDREKLKLDDMRRANLASGKTDFHSSHFDQPNIFVHFRTSEFIDVDGKLVVVVHEIQSDWAQTGRKKGFGSQGTWRVLDESGQLIAQQPTQKDADEIARQYRAGETPVQRANGAAGAAATVSYVADAIQGVPNTPFKATDEWAMLAFKAIVRHAAEIGADRIAWTTGEQQADRYDLSKQVDKVDVQKTGENEYRLRVYDKSDKSVIRKDGVTAEGLADHIGKELAERAVKEGGRIYTGVDLKVGGEGMRGFYDKILPAAINKWGKKFGVRVGETKIGGVYEARVSNKGSWYVVDLAAKSADMSQSGVAGPFKTEAEAQAKLIEIGGPSLHSIDLTTSMRDAALAGQPLFSRTAPTQAAYEQRIDELLAGDSAARQGVKVLDRADILGLLGFGDKPLHLKESSVGKQRPDGRVAHQNMTAALWKRLPEWIENPVAVFKSQTIKGALVLIAPEQVSGKPVRVILEPNEGMGGVDVHMLANAYDEAGSGTQHFDDWTHKAKALVYLDKTKTSPASGRTVWHYLPRDVRQLRGYTDRVLTEADLVKYRAENPAPGGRSGLQLPGEDRPAQDAGTVPQDTDKGNPDIRFSRAEPTNTAPFRNWFRKSQVVNASGSPKKVYHGTASEFWTFDKDRLASSTGHMTAPLGFFFAEDQAKAQRYAEKASEGVPADERVVDVYLSIQNAKPMTLAAFMEVDSQDEARALRTTLQKQGFDGIHIAEIGQWIAFEPSQAKSASENAGAFDATNDDIRFSRRPPADVMADVEAVMAAGQGKDMLQRAKEMIAGWVPAKLKDEHRPTWLAALTTSHLTELGADYFAGIESYSEILARMGADRNQLQQDGDDVAERMRQWSAKHPQEARRMFKLAHDATISGADPAKDYSPLQFRFSGQLHVVTNKSIREAIKAIKQQILERSGDNKQDMLNEIKRLRAMMEAEPRRKASHPGMVARWNALSPEAKAFYIEMRDKYVERSKMVEEGLIARINDTDAADNHKRRLIAVIRQQFETQRLQGVYFPLQRHGRYFVAADKGDTSTFIMYETLSQLERGVKALKDRGFEITAQGLKTEGMAKEAPSGTFVADVIGKLKAAHISEEMQDNIYQLYLQALPEMSMRKHAIHRQAVPGFDPDAVRAFAFNMHHGAHQIARLRHAHHLADTLAALKKGQDASRKDPEADTRKIAAGDAILGELGLRHQWIMDPQDSALTAKVSSFGFVYYLGLTPAAALVNLTQTALISFPYLAARYGPVRAMNQLLKGMGGSIASIGHLQKRLTDPDELRAHADLQHMGALDKTQAHNLAGIAEGGMTGYSPALAKAMQIVAMPFHKAEVMNREATGIAAYRLARADGATHEAAVKDAARAINDTHYDYTNQNRARVMQSGTAKVLLMFKQYSLNTTWHIGRMLWQATKNESPEVRKIARRNLAGVLGMTSLFAGTLGLPMMSVTFGVLNAIAASFGDDDEPWDAETEFRAFLSDMFGEGAGEVIATGAANKLTGADIHSRVSMSQLWFRDADRELDGRGAYWNMLEQAAGPMGGVLKNALVGKQMIDEGRVMRGVETMLPKALKDTLKAQRYATEGVNNMRGDPLVEDLSLHETLLQLAGFTPAQVADQYDTNRSLKNYEQHILKRRQFLMDAFAMALRTEDDDGRVEVLEKIRAFNQTNPEIQITPKGLRTSIGQRARYTANAENGITLNKRLSAKVRDAVGAD